MRAPNLAFSSFIENVEILIEPEPVDASEIAREGGVAGDAEFRQVFERRGHRRDVEIGFHNR